MNNITTEFDEKDLNLIKQSLLFFSTFTDREGMVLYTDIQELLGRVNAMLDLDDLIVNNDDVVKEGNTKCL